MRAGRFQDAKRIYQGALEREPAERDSFLTHACGGDESLRHEVESLLKRQTEAREFFAVLAAEAGARALPLEPPVDFTGRVVSHYAILEKIGEGGMGVVYKARDAHLDRFVALKVLPPGKVTDPERRRRFAQEAKAASALNHPNIVTIHDIDTAGGTTFIAMEFVQGTTLDKLLRGGGIPVGQMLKQGLQIADALAAAHAAGIVHRDIKPANIMVTSTGLIKVLDFGLAKLAGPADIGSGETTPTNDCQTQDGVILGTVAYMSPEQAQGRDVDARSDIFSFGLVLYEMATGRRAFEGKTRAATLEAIVREEPPPVSQVSAGTPPGLEKVISRCIQKDPQRRFQHLSDVRLALEALALRTDPETPAAVRRRRTAWVAAAFVLAAALGLAVWLGLLRRPAPGPVPWVRAFAALPGMQTGPALSPDGAQIAFLWNGDKQDHHDIYVQSVDETTPRRLTNDAADEYSPVWSPGSERLAFLRNSPGGTDVFIIPASGGTESRVHVSMASCQAVLPQLARQYCGMAWSPNGRFLSVVDKESPEASNSIFLLDLETRRKRKLTNPRPRAYQDGVSAFSPDGRTLAFARCAGPLCDIYVLPIADSGEPRGEPRRVTRDNAYLLGLDWAADGRGIVFASPRGGVWALWRASASGGNPERLEVSGSNAFFPTVSRSGNRLAYSEGVTDFNVWRVAAPGAPGPHPAAAPARMTQSPQADGEPVYAPDGGKIAWSSMHSGTHQIWVSDGDGSQPVQVTNFPSPGAASPSWSPDGRLIAFLGFSSGPTEVCVAGAGGGAARCLGTGDLIHGLTLPPTWSSDGRWIYFVSNRDGAAIWKAPAGGGPPVLLVPEGSFPVESAGGQSLYYLAPGAAIWKLPLGGAPPVRIARDAMPPLFLSPDGASVYYYGLHRTIWKSPAGGGTASPVVEAGGRARWCVTSSGLYVLDPDSNGGPALGFLPFGSRRRTVVALPGDASGYVQAAGNLGVSPDGRWALYPRRDRNEAQIMLVESFR